MPSIIINVDMELMGANRENFVERKIFQVTFIKTDFTCKYHMLKVVDLKRHSCPRQNYGLEFELDF